MKFPTCCRRSQSGSIKAGVKKINIFGCLVKPDSLLHVARYFVAVVIIRASVYGSCCLTRSNLLQSPMCSLLLKVIGRGVLCFQSVVVVMRILMRVTVEDRPFASAGPRAWNSLPEDVTSAPSLPVFRRKLKTHLFRHSYPDIVTAP